MFRTIRNRFAVGFLIAAFLTGTLPMPSYAAMIGTDRAIATYQRSDDAAAVQAFLARDDVAQQLEKHGVDPTEIQGRVAALTDEEIAQLSAQIDELPAGAGVIAIVGVVFVVLMILELVGVTNVFTAF